MHSFFFVVGFSWPRRWREEEGEVFGFIVCVVRCCVAVVVVVDLLV